MASKRVPVIQEPSPDPSNPGKQPAKWRSWLRWRYLLLAGFWLGMFIGTHLPKMPQPIRKVSDKTMHGLAFAGLAYLLTWATYRKDTTATRHWTFILILIAVYGAIDELLQIPVGRHCDFNDWLADMGGAFVGLTVFYMGLKMRTPSSASVVNEFDQAKGANESNLYESKNLKP